MKRKETRRVSLSLLWSWCEVGVVFRLQLEAGGESKLFVFLDLSHARSVASFQFDDLPVVLLGFSAARLTDRLTNNMK